MDWYIYLRISCHYYFNCSNRSFVVICLNIDRSLKASQSDEYFYRRAILHLDLHGIVVMLSYLKYININMLHILFWFSNNIFVAQLLGLLFCWLCPAAQHINGCLMPILHTYLLDNILRRLNPMCNARCT